jgi:hypothetical protein
MPVLPRRRHEVSEPVEELKWGKLDDAAGARPCGLPPTSQADPVGRLVSGEHVADAGDAAVFAADHGEPLQREGRPGTVSQQVLETLKIARQQMFPATSEAWGKAPCSPARMDRWYRKSKPASTTQRFSLSQWCR